MFTMCQINLQIWVFGDLWCQIWLAVDVWMCTASILNLCAISLDRYVAVTRPVTYPSIMSTKRAKLLVAGVWVLSFVICFPPLVGLNNNSGVGGAGSVSGDFAARADGDGTANGEPNNSSFGQRTDEVCLLKLCGFFDFQPSASRAIRQPRSADVSVLLDKRACKAGEFIG